LARNRVIEAAGSKGRRPSKGGTAGSARPAATTTTTTTSMTATATTTLRTARGVHDGERRPKTAMMRDRAARQAPRIGVAPAPLHVDPLAPHVDGEALLRAEQCVALLQRRLIKPMSRGGPRSELTLTQYHALSFLAARGQASVSELKDILGCAQSTTSVLVDKLARMGLVDKLRDRRDHRLACVVPLPKGLRMVQRYRKNAERNLLALRAHLGEHAVRDVFEALERALVATAPLEDPRVAATGGDDDNDDGAREAAE
jgi:DNA-binding MarR family transcriptional regulator